eukprot:m.47219 g.47219  ORF g.47219 m.47219 type:complete len:732 (+) comp11243_c0_seq1:98-2293(+)
MASVGPTDFATRPMDGDISSVPLLEIRRLSPWLTCVCVFVFDLERGQALETVYPPSCLPQATLDLIKFLAFPDSNTGSMDEQEFSLRVPTAINKNCFHYGAVHFRQWADPSVRRGYVQKSVVVITDHAFVDTYSWLARQMATAYFDQGVVGIAAACHDICCWPPPRPGAHLTLNVGGSTLEVEIPFARDTRLMRCPSLNSLISTSPSTSLQSPPHHHPHTRAPSTHTEAHPLTSSSTSTSLSLSSHASLSGPRVDTVPRGPASSPTTILRPVLNQAQLLWELILFGEPVVVSAPTPSSCSAAVLALTSLIHPLHYHGDFRPYFTIYDLEYPLYSSRATVLPATIVGVTNPCFVSAFEHWPNLVRVVAPRVRVRKASESTVPAAHSPTLAGKAKPGVISQHRPFLKEDLAAIKQMLKDMTTCSDDDLDTRFRQHLEQLTTTFMIPLEQYLARLMPLRRTVSVFQDIPTIEDFNAKKFLLGLQPALPGLTRFRAGNWPALYTRFLKSVNFAGWWLTRKATANAELAKLFLEHALETDWPVWARQAGRLEIAETIARLRDAMSRAQKGSSLPPPLHASTLRVVELLTSSLSSPPSPSLAAPASPTLAGPPSEPLQGLADLPEIVEGGEMSPRDPSPFFASLPAAAPIRSLSAAPLTSTRSASTTVPGPALMTAAHQGDVDLSQPVPHESSSSLSAPAPAPAAAAPPALLTGLGSGQGSLEDRLLALSRSISALQ